MRRTLLPIFNIRLTYNQLAGHGLTDRKKYLQDVEEMLKYLQDPRCTVVISKS